MCLSAAGAAPHGVPAGGCPPTLQELCGQVCAAVMLDTEPALLLGVLCLVLGLCAGACAGVLVCTHLSSPLTSLVLPLSMLVTG